MNERAKNLALLLLRFAGLYLAFAHGWGKVAALAAGETRFIEGVAKLGFPAPALFAWAAALAEFGGGLLIAFGLATRWAAFFAAFTMFVAAFIRHQAVAQWLAAAGLAAASEEQLKAWGNPEMATLFLLIFLALLLSGGGGWSLDAALTRRKKRG